MTQAAFDNQELRKLLKEVITETLTEQRGLINEVITEALEDVGFAEAIREGRSSELVDRSVVLDILSRQS
jgi:hypothetical protein